MRPSVVALALALLLPLPLRAAEVVVQPGETLSEIAERAGVSLSRLMQVNGITDPDLVEAGRSLTLPGGSGSTARSTSPARSSGGGRGSGGSVVVQPGETLSEIAERAGISVSRLMQINGISDPDLVEAGRSLRLGGAATAAAPAPAAQPTYPRGASSHVVRDGESLSEIADGYGVPMSRLVALNAISDPDLVMSGTRLRLSGPVPASTPAPRASAPAASRPAAAARPAPTSQPRPTPAATPIAAASAATPIAAATTAAPTAMAATPAPARPRPQPAATVAAATAAPAGSTSTGRADWRSYGPLQVDWANWQSMGGSLVAPTLNRDGESLYLAINCGARKLNATTPTGQWKTWDEPQSDFEQQMISDLCTSRSN